MLVTVCFITNVTPLITNYFRQEPQLLRRQHIPCSPPILHIFLPYRILLQLTKSPRTLLRIRDPTVPHLYNRSHPPPHHIFNKPTACPEHCPFQMGRLPAPSPLAPPPTPANKTSSGESLPGPTRQVQDALSSPSLCVVLLPSSLPLSQPRLQPRYKSLHCGGCLDVPLEFLPSVQLSCYPSSAPAWQEAGRVRAATRRLVRSSVFATLSF